MNTQPTYILRMVPMRGVNEVSALKRLLKYASRGCGIRCESIEQATTTTTMPTLLTTLSNKVTTAPLGKRKQLFTPTITTTLPQDASADAVANGSDAPTRRGMVDAGEAGTPPIIRSRNLQPLKKVPTGLRETRAAEFRGEFPLNLTKETN
ncbi:MAG: hypothetical protein K8S99_12225 [Planctomycetes bacterium]|nr:hypothetical protein [Planctomycetota bacterium]